MNIIKQAEKFAVSKFKKLKQPWRQWYYLHSKYVGISASEINPKLDKDIFKIAGWLHDVAKVKSDKNHSKESAKIAKKFLKDKIDDDKLKIILDCIANHGKKDHPKTKEGKIIQSADKLAIFYPGVRRFIIKATDRKTLDNMLKEHYSEIKMRKAKLIAKKLSRIIV